MGEILENEVVRLFRRRRKEITVGQHLESFVIPHAEILNGD